MIPDPSGRRVPVAGGSCGSGHATAEAAIHPICNGRVTAGIPGGDSGQEVGD